MTAQRADDLSRCPHVHLRGVRGEEAKQAGGFGRQCTDCERYLDGSPFWAGSPTGDHLWEHSLGKLDADDGDLPPLLWYCQPSVAFAWDQWAQCTLTCGHGSFQGVAGGVNFTEAFDAALAEYTATDHPTDPDDL